MAGQIPSEMFVKYRILDMGEEYNPDIHNMGDTIRERGAIFYGEEDLIRMEEEREAEIAEIVEREGERLNAVRCAICMNFIIDVEECTVCSDGHKFHKKCIRPYWRQSGKYSICPLTNTIPSGEPRWKNCIDINNLHSGGKRRKRRYSKKNKNKKNHKRNFSKSKKRK